MKSFFLSAAALPLPAACATVPADTGAIEPQAAPSVLESVAPATGSGPVVSGNALVTAADPRAAEVGAQILRQGGSATDAAIAVMLALTVVEPQSSGIGGGGFFVRGDASGAVTTIDGRETAPAAAGEDWFIDSEGNSVGYRGAVMTGLSIGVPGNLRLAELAHARHGRLEWAQLVAPAIELASGGFTLSERGHEYLERYKQRASRDGGADGVYFDAVGEALPVGTRIVNPELAVTLRLIAGRGPGALYRGGIAANLAAEIAADTPGDAAMQSADLEAYRAMQRPPVCGDYRGYRICGMGPPSSGATTVFAILKQLERFDLAALGPDNPIFWHLFAESQRLAYADRERYLADSDFVPVPTGWLTDPAYLATRSALISPDRRMVEVAAGIAPQAALAPPDGDEPPERGTTHFAVVDNAGNAVSYTSTIEGPFGSGLMFGGFYLNNELTDFSFSPEMDGRPVANRVEGGKRPRSSMAPTLVYAPNGSLFMAVGAAGGGTIPVQTARSIIAAIDFGLPVDKTLAFPMLYSPGDSMAVEEGTMLESLIPALQALGHEVSARRLPLKANAILCRAGKPCAGAGDPRSEGVAVSANSGE